MGRRHTGVQRRRNTWFLRRRVPADVRGPIGRTEIVRSLKTQDYTLAVQRAPLEALKIDEEFARARTKLIHAHDVTDAEAERMAVGYFAMRDAMNAATAAGVFGDNRAEALDTCLADLNAWQYGRDPDLLPGLQATARKLVRERGLSVDGMPPGMWAFLGYIRRAEVELALRFRDHLEGRTPEHRDPMFRDAIAAVEKDEAITVEGAIREFMREPSRDLSRKMALDWNFSHRVLREVCGDDTPLRDVDRVAIRKVRDLLVRLPSNAAKKYPAMTLEQAATAGEKDGAPTMRARTVNAHLGRISSFLKWSQQEGYVARNPAEGLRVARDVSAAGARMPFDLAQLERIFGTEYATHAGARRWVSLLSLFLGLRLGEASQLRTQDVREVDGVLCVAVDPEAGPLKSAASRRLVPVHKTLVALGFVKFVEDAKQEERDLLFPELPLDRRGYRSDAFQKWFSRYATSVGAAAPRTSFHSFRHCFRDQLREQQVPRDVALQLGGWTSGSVADSYGSGVGVKTLRKWADKLDYGLDLGHLSGSPAPRKRRRR